MSTGAETAGAEQAIETLCRDYERCFPTLLKIAAGELVLPGHLVPLMRAGLRDIAARFRHAGTVLDNALESVDPETAAAYLRDSMIGIRFEASALSAELSEHIHN